MTDFAEGFLKFCINDRTLPFRITTFYGIITCRLCFIFYDHNKIFMTFARVIFPPNRREVRQMLPVYLPIGLHATRRR